MKTSNEVYVELTEDVSRIGVYFRYDENDIRSIKTVRGYRFHGDDKPKFWSVPMKMSAARQLRGIFGERMKLGPAMRMWAKEQVKLERNLRSLSTATDAELFHTPQIILDVIAGRPIEHPSIPRSHVLRRERAERSYQRADIRMMALSNAINGNDVGTGKTLEAIAAIYEAKLNPKPILVIAPRRTLVNVWQTEFSRWSDYKCWASEQPSERKAYMNYVAADVDDPSGNVVCVIADDVRLDMYSDNNSRAIIDTGKDQLHARNDYVGSNKARWYRFQSETQRDFYQVEWGAVIIDEFHSVGLPNRNSLFSMSVNLLKTERRWPMSGTPIGGKVRRLWPILNFIEPKEYPHEWPWIEEWLEVSEDQIYTKGGRGRTRTVRTVGNNIIEGKEDEFYDAHKKHLIRRTKKDALPGIPDAIEIIVDTPMSGRQLDEYNRFDDEHEVVLEGSKRMSGPNVLAQYTRLRQMANTRLKFYSGSVKSKPEATNDSGKLEQLTEKLEECGIRKATADNPAEPGVRAYIGVLDKSFLTVVCDHMAKLRIDCGRLDGGAKSSKPMIDRFNGDDEKPYVIAMTIQTGGTGINLERAGSAHALDEAWDPDIMTQFFGRGDRGARDTPLKCFIYRTPNSIQEYVAAVAEGKSVTNNNVLDFAKAVEEMRRQKK